MEYHHFSRLLPSGGLPPFELLDQFKLSVRNHYSFVKEGVPAVSLETGWANGGQAAVKAFLDAHYHDVSDDMSQKIDWNVAAKFAKLNYLIAKDLADGSDAPRWYAGDFFGDKFAAGQPKASKGHAAP